jgi:hypothetical protein
MYFLLKILLTAVLVAGISEAGKRFTTFGAILASLPLTSLLAFIWLYIDTKDVQKVADLSREIIWMVIPSFIFFITLPLLLKTMKFFPSLILAASATAISYFFWIMLIRKIGWIN